MICILTAFTESICPMLNRSKKLRVLWFIPVDHSDYNRMSASVWIRCLQLLPWLETYGIESVVNRYDEAADVVVFVRMQDDRAFKMAKKQKEKGRRVVFDLVVNYFEEAEVRNLGKQVRQQHIDECHAMLSVADAVTCASEFISQKASEHHHSSFYMPDSVNSAHFRFVKQEKDFFKEKLRAVWSGYSVKARELEPVLPLLKDNGIGLTLISEKKPSLFLPGRFFRKKFDFDYIPWRYDSFPESIMAGEISLGCRDLDTPYNMGHSIFKIGVFMAQGVPAIASPVPSYLDLLGDGSGGCLCDTEEEWAATLSTIASDRNVLASWSSGARKKMEPFMTGFIARKYAILLYSLAGLEMPAEYEMESS